jgi:DNA-binding MarR family transcriptional regulator
MLHRVNDVVDDMIGRWHQDGEPADPSALATFTRMGLIVQQIRDHKAAVVDRLGMPMWAISTVYALRRQGRPYRSTPTALAAELGVTQAAMTARVRHLVDRGLVVTGADPDDGRRVVITLTAKGHRLTERVVRLQAGVEEERLAPLSPRERAVLGRLLRRVLAGSPRPAE